MANLNPDIFEIYVNNLIDELCYSDIDISTLNILDKFYILLSIRAYCIAPTITFQTTTGDDKKEKINIEIDVNKMLDTLYDVKLEYDFNIEYDNIQITGNFPKRFHFDDVYDLAADSICEVRFENKPINYSELTKEQRQEVYSRLPSLVMPQILKHLQKQDKILKQEPIIEINTKKEINMSKRTCASMLDGSMSELIKVMFKTPLRDFYVNEYNLMKRFKFSSDAINQSTPAELGLYFNIIQQDLEKEKKEMEKQQGQRGGVNMPGGGMGAPS